MTDDLRIAVTDAPAEAATAAIADGLGARVLAMAEEEGRRRGCAVIALFTLEFQAPGFYRKQGYTEAARLAPPPPGTTRYLMTKSLL